MEHLRKPPSPICPMLNYINPRQRMRLMKSSCVSFAAQLTKAFAVKARTGLLFFSSQFMLPIPDSHFVSMSSFDNKDVTVRSQKESMHLCMVCGAITLVSLSNSDFYS